MLSATSSIKNSNITTAGLLAATVAARRHGRNHKNSPPQTPKGHVVLHDAATKSMHKMYYILS
jgi:hypothetical protein